MPEIDFDRAMGSPQKPESGKEPETSKVEDPKPQETTPETKVGSEKSSEKSSESTPETKPGQTPKSDDPKPQESRFDFSQFGEEFKDESSLKEFIDKSRNAQQELEALKSKKPDLPGGDPTLYKLAKVKETNPDNYDLAKKVAFSEMDPVDLLIMKRESESERFKKLDPEDKREYIESKYNISHDLEPLDPEEHDEAEVEARNKEIKKAEKAISRAKIEMELDAEEALKTLEDSLFGDIEVPEMLSEQEKAEKAEAARQELTKAWEPRLQPLKSMQNIDITSWDASSKSEKAMFDMEIPGQTVEKYVDDLRDMLVTSGQEPDKFSEEDLKEYVVNRFHEDNRSKIHHEIAVKARAASSEEYQEMMFNPSKPSGPEPGRPDPQTPKTTESEIERAIKQW